ncbi:MAG: permease-like cell division protein FtsX [Actinobacteria bacterium]|nr:permease-like cell division protein FtsX [Actinomycetota bacterium]MCI0677440.1 permease-like cell division protein FtsX [Actinomycetota bacterium]
MSKVIFLIKEALVSLRRNILIVTGAVLAVFISLSLAFGALVVNEVLRVNTVAWQQGVHVIAFLNDEDQNQVPSGAHATLQTQVEQWEEVLSVGYVSKSEAWLEFQEIFANREELLDIDPTILPASLRIELVDIAFHESVRFRLEQQQQVVRQVATAADSIEQLQNLSNVLNVLGLGMAIVLGLSAVVLIANTIRLAIYARRDEVAIMKLVGASNWFVRVPFLLEGLIEGLVGAALAVFAVWLGSTNLARAGEGFVLFRLDVSEQWFLRWGLLFLVFGALAGVIGSMLGLSRYLRDADGTGPDVPTGF